MKLKDLEINIQIFKNFFHPKAEINIEKASDVYLVKDKFFSDDKKDRKVPGSEFPGVYLYVYNNRVIFIGESESQIGKKVLSHLGSPDWENQTFPYHQWAKERCPDPDRQEEFQIVSEAVKQGNIGIVTIVIKPGYFSLALKAFLLSRKELPVLNL